MKHLKIVLLVLAIGFGCSAPAITKFSNFNSPNALKGGLIAVQIFKPAKFAVLAVEGYYENYLLSLKFKLNYKKVEEEQDQKKEIISSSCTWVPWL